MAERKKKAVGSISIWLKLLFGLLPVLAFTGVAFAGWIIWDTNQKDTQERIDLANRRSEGEKTLFPISEASLEKKDAIETFAKKDCANAVNKWNAYLERQPNPNDPEAVIYRNNAKICDQPSIKIAVILPLNPDKRDNIKIGKEILRGVAMSQNDANEGKGLPIKIILLNDENKSEIAKRVAKSLVLDNSILAVMGHNASDASLAAAPIYQDAKLVMISSTSTSNNFSKQGEFIFRTVPSGYFQAKELSKYAVKKVGKKNIGICISNAAASKSLKEDFTRSVLADEGKISPVECNLENLNFNADEVLQKMSEQNVDALLLAPGIQKIKEGIEIATVARKRFLLLSDSTLYTEDALIKGQDAISDMILTTPWSFEYVQTHQDLSQSATKFIDNAKKTWGGPVNWRSATSYDAILAVTNGLREGNSNSREGLQKTLSRSSFVIKNGVVGTIAFLDTGDRADPKTFLVKVSKDASSAIGYKFESVE